MWSLFFLGLLVASWVGFAVYFKKQRSLVQSLTKARQKVEVEEGRVFDFLHGLGEAFAAEIRSEELHRLIVEGATRILEAQGGALHMVDRQGAVLTARFIS